MTEPMPWLGVLRTALKPLVERLLVGSGVLGIRRAGLRGRTLILAYHNIVPDGSEPTGDLPTHLPQSAFGAQLDALARTHEVVPLERADDTTGARPRVAITFDDAYHGAVTLGVEELSRRGLPATIFVAPHFVDGGTFWWDALAQPGPRGLDPAVRQAALSECRGDDLTVRRWAADRGLRAHALPPAWHVATESQLRQAMAHPGIGLGSHSWSHPNLPLLVPQELERELSLPLEWLRDRFPRVVPWIAYPYGLATPAVAQAAAAVGYQGGVCITGGWTNPPGTHPLLRPRLNVPAGLSHRGFLLRVNGVLAS